MIRSFRKNSKFFLLGGLLMLCLGLANCGKKDGKTADNRGLFDDDTDVAVNLIHEANRNLRSIRALYNENNENFTKFKKAVSDKDNEKIKELSNELSLAIIDGYVLADNAKEKIDKAKRLSGISPDFRRYLELKSESLDMQIKAFNYRRDSAKLFRDEAGTDDEARLDEAKAKFIENEKKFDEYMEEAKKLNTQADEIWSESRRQRG